MLLIVFLQMLRIPCPGIHELESSFSWENWGRENLSALTISTNIQTRNNDSFTSMIVIPLNTIILEGRNTQAY